MSAEKGYLCTMHANFNLQYADILKNLSISQFNEMQNIVIEKATIEPHITLLSPTGSGKTLGFLIPLLNVLKTDVQEVQALIVVPSRELALQIEHVFKSMKTSFKVSCCYGGHSTKIEQNSLSEAPALVIGTPGRIADHITRNSFDPSKIKLVVLDEFDKSLQMGYEDDLKVIFHSLNKKQKHILTSATPLNTLPDFFPFKKPFVINLLKEERNDKLEFKLLRTKSTDKVESTMRLIAGFNQEVCLVFCNHRDAVDRISSVFTHHGFEHGTLHGALEQIDREKNLIKFRGGAHNVLIATDLAARGLDIPEIKHIVHYQTPPQREAFIHRNGRTARMHAEGTAYLVLAADEELSPYLDWKINEITISPKLKLPPPPKFICIYISAGKKEKISKGDIVGLLMKKGELQNEDIGLITILDHSSYVSINRELAEEVLSRIKNEKLKKLKVKFEIAN